MSSQQLTGEEAAFLLNLMERMQIQGTPAQVKETLSTVDSIMRKLRETASPEKKEVELPVAR